MYTACLLCSVSNLFPSEFGSSIAPTKQTPLLSVNTLSIPSYIERVPVPVQPLPRHPHKVCPYHQADNPREVNAQKNLPKIDYIPREIQLERGEVPENCHQNLRAHFRLEKDKLQTHRRMRS